MWDENNDKIDSDTNKRKAMKTSYTALGIALGNVFGIAFKNVALGIVLGVAIGVGIDWKNRKIVNKGLYL